MRIPSNLKLPSWQALDKRGKEGFNCNKQESRAVIVLNCVLKGSWKEGESRDIRKKLKYKSIAYL